MSAAADCFHSWASQNRESRQTRVQLKRVWVKTTFSRMNAAFLKMSIYIFEEHALLRKEKLVRALTQRARLKEFLALYYEHAKEAHQLKKHAIKVFGRWCKSMVRMAFDVMKHSADLGQRTRRNGTKLLFWTNRSMRSRAFRLFALAVLDERRIAVSTMSVVMHAHQKLLANAFHGLRIVTWHHSERKHGTRALRARIFGDIRAFCFHTLLSRVIVRRSLTYKAKKLLAWQHQRFSRSLTPSQNSIDVDSFSLDAFHLNSSIANTRCLLRVFGHFRLLLRHNRSTSSLAIRILRGTLSNAFWALRNRVKRFKYLHRACLAIVFKRSGFLLHDIFGVWSSAAYQYHRLYHRYKVVIDTMLPKTQRRVLQIWAAQCEKKRGLYDTQSILMRVTRRNMLRKQLRRWIAVSRLLRALSEKSAVLLRTTLVSATRTALDAWCHAAKCHAWIDAVLKRASQATNKKIENACVDVWYDSTQYSAWLESIVTISTGSSLQKTQSECFQVWRDCAGYRHWCGSLLTTCLVYRKARTQRSSLREWGRFSCANRCLSASTTKLTLRAYLKVESKCFTLWADYVCGVAATLGKGVDMVARFGERRRMHRILHSWLKACKDTLRSSLQFEIRNDVLRFASLKRGAFEVWMEVSHDSQQLVKQHEQDEWQQSLAAHEREKAQRQSLEQDQETHQQVALQQVKHQKRMAILALPGWHRAQKADMRLAFLALYEHWQAHWTRNRKVCTILQSVFYSNMSLCFLKWRDQVDET